MGDVGLADNTVFIVGAGFSANAGLPLQTEFTDLFLRARAFKKGRSKELMPFLDEFIKETFGFRITDELEFYPELEDVFTLLDLSANTGHHLGVNFSPGRLRKLRRMLLSRTIHMLNTAYIGGRENESTPERKKLLEFISKLNAERHQFVSLNWDVVLEGCLAEMEVGFQHRYCREVIPADIQDDQLLIEETQKVGEKKLLIAKMHGSINWLYCDCCRRAYSVPVERVSRLGTQVLRPEESEELYKEKAPARLRCPHCEVDLGVRLATFSFQKALRAPMFESSWLEAEKALRRAASWVFIGYSLPAADFEFKYLLKRIQLARKDELEIVVVTKAKSQKDSPAVKSYRKFFGKDRCTVFSKGLDDRAMDFIFDSEE